MKSCKNICILFGKNCNTEILWYASQLIGKMHHQLSTKAQNVQIYILHIPPPLQSHMSAGQLGGVQLQLLTHQASMVGLPAQAPW